MIHRQKKFKKLPIVGPQIGMNQHTHTKDIYVQSIQLMAQWLHTRNQQTGGQNHRRATPDPRRATPDPRQARQRQEHERQEHERQEHQKRGHQGQRTKTRKLKHQEQTEQTVEYNLLRDLLTTTFVNYPPPWVRNSRNYITFVNYKRFYLLESLHFFIASNSISMPKIFPYNRNNKNMTPPPATNCQSQPYAYFR